MRYTRKPPDCWFSQREGNPQSAVDRGYLPALCVCERVPHATSYYVKAGLSKPIFSVAVTASRPVSRKFHKSITDFYIPFSFPDLSANMIRPSDTLALRYFQRP